MLVTIAENATGFQRLNDRFASLTLSSRGKSQRHYGVAGGFASDIQSLANRHTARDQRSRVRANERLPFLRFKIAKEAAARLKLSITNRPPRVGMNL